ncbi:HAD family phosphatase [Paenibacillus psychroresistens]|uniref:HAD family phosphatase n=1 Tax=Paenibacillus psychroresistens TaxID=1778678 RepID=A0A6B8RQ42_9BACL|nr:Cof-type HAD-IIB family hydrolase [Paenibacillus psychroresistens]QGQ97418.1 HAD family phosphatase [Paenibacillus psychroresistens]
MNYKLIALDVDGTLLNDEYMLTEKTKYAVKRANDAGAQIVLCTGRGPQNTLPILAELGLEGIVITHNGAATVQSKDLKILHEVTFLSEDIKPFIEYCRAKQAHFAINAPFEIYVEEFNDEIKAMYNKFKLEPIVTKDAIALDIDRVKLSVFSERTAMDQIEADWRAMASPLSIIRSGHHFIDIMHAEASKGHALRRLAEDKGIKQEEIMAIGNYYNDSEMILYAGLGIAMANSPEPLKLQANELTGSNNEDGVYQAIMKYCF